MQSTEEKDMSSPCRFISQASLGLVFSFVVNANETEDLTVERNLTESHCLARQWGLNDAEWTRFEQLKKSERGIWSPSLDPLTMLGVEASDDQARRYYAELLVQKEHQRVEKELAFQRAYDAAWQRLYPKLSPIKNEELTTSSDKANVRLAVFLRGNSISCTKKLKSLLALRKPLDIYLVESQNDDARLRQWAMKNHIDANRVRNREITLNHDAGRWLQLGNGQLPAVLEHGGN